MELAWRLFDPLVLVASALAALCLMGWALVRALAATLPAPRANVYFLLCAASAVLGQVQVTLTADTRVHLLLAPLLTLVFGPALAVIGGAAALALTLVVAPGRWPGLGLALLTAVAVPVFVTHGWRRLLARRLPSHPFVLFIGAGFFGGVLAWLATLAVGSAVLLLAGVSAAALRDGVLSVALLLALPEGFLTGAVLSGLAIYHPEWVEGYEPPP